MAIKIYIYLLSAMADFSVRTLLEHLSFTENEASYKKFWNGSTLSNGVLTCLKKHCVLSIII